eukprot:CAMPEP_0113958334 /NCGR_PEP_ID=MMETSP0011_2-20120614/3338_1 /TAXON_ID=101924 /ORGANISM="Rhodosorus marinus" /LENGTH=371 /DNA_ID=CAMNT_0000969137 /DNA_START=364 /DNA_END=1479 /DNA_ORIENTATION=- /assembly_acc=CAM_ASM_000156
MEGNRDDAEKCAALANRALADGDIDRAIRLSKKSLRLFPNDAAEKILKKASGARSAPSGQGPHSPNNRRRAPAGSNNNKEQAEEKPCTPEQMEHVRRVLRAKTLYEVLGIETTADESAIKKAYKVTALKLHPDKNPAPKADEAFKRVSHAFQVLSDPSRRTRYDQIGEESETPTLTRRTRSQGMYSQELSPEEIFEMFFGGGVPNQFNSRSGFYRYETRPRARPTHAQAANASRSSFFALLPVLVIMLAMLMMNISSDMTETEFSLKRYNQFKIERRTLKGGISYFVKSGFDDKYRGQDLRRVEARVVTAYVNQVTSMCQSEQMQKQRLIDASNSILTSRSDREKYRAKADTLLLKNCLEFKRLQTIGIVH